MSGTTTEHPPWVEAAICPDERDDDAYVAMVWRVVGRLTAEHVPYALCITKIDNWFDHKWLRFTRAQWGRDREVRPPPFTPNRIVETFWYGRIDDRVYSPSPNAPWMFADRRSMQIWWTGNTRSNQRGALMCYLFDGDAALETWYAALAASPDWRCTGIRGLSAKRFGRLMEPVSEAQDIESLRKRPAGFLDADDVDGLRDFVTLHWDAIQHDFQLCWNTGWTWFRLGHHDQALPLLEKAVALEPDNPVGIWGLGVVCMESGMAERAETLFRKALECQDGWLARHCLAVLLLDEGREVEGEALLREGVNNKPRSPLRLDDLADYLEDVGKTAEAAAVRDRARTLRSAKEKRK